MARKKKSTVSTLSTTAYKNVVLKDNDKNILLPRTDSSLVLYDESNVSSTLDTLRSDKQDKLKYYTEGSLTAEIALDADRTAIEVAENSITLWSGEGEGSVKLHDDIFTYNEEEVAVKKDVSDAESNLSSLIATVESTLTLLIDDVRSSITVSTVSGLANLTIWRGSLHEYDELLIYDDNTLYFIYEE